MKVRFGLLRDGLDPAPPHTSLGEVTVGPLGLLQILETDLGLPPVLGHAAARVIAYRRCLDEANDFARFYHASFAVDPIGVASTLLRWRDEWTEAGWDGSFTGSEQRLADMGAVEVCARERVSAGIGERLRRVLTALKKRRTQVRTLILLDDPDELPLAWRRVVDAIGFVVSAGVLLEPRAAAGSDLQTMQAQLLSTVAETDKVRLRGDGSVVIIKAVSRDISARALAEMLRVESDGSCVVIAERDGIIFDNALERSGLPRCGFQHRSRFRAVTQVLKLSLALLWQPLDPHLLLQFLLHPLGPLPRGVRQPLAEAVAAQPGIDGALWRGAVERILAGRDEADAREVLEAIRYWFGGERFGGPGGVRGVRGVRGIRGIDGAPIDVLAERTQRVASWLLGRLATADDEARSVFAASYAQCEALLAALAQFDEHGQNAKTQTRVEKIELDRLLDEVTRAQPDPHSFSQIGHVRAATDPALITDVWDEVIWWDMQAQHVDFAYPWSGAEVKALAQAGVSLPAPEDRLGHVNRHWLRAVVNCRKRLILVIHHSDAGYHPLWSQIQHRFTGWAELALDETLLGGDRESLPLLDVETPVLSVQPLPLAKRWWTLPSTVNLPLRDVESYSSLRKLYDHPHEWVLHYAGRLRAGRTSDLADGPLLYGSLGHRLLERFFTEHQDWAASSPSDIDAWLAEALPALIAEEGAVLLEAGRGVDRQYVTTTLERALARLVEHLREARIVDVATEHHDQVPYQEGALQGDIDLLLTDESGRCIVMDAKWGSEPFREREMQSNRHLQLATYAYLRRTATGSNSWPYPAYFIITTGNVLAPDDTVFPQALVQAPPPDQNIETLWQQSESTFRWRRGQLDAGLIEVNVAGTVPTERSYPPPDGLDTLVDPDRFDDFGRLTGE
ncbi:MAG: PD-(D/E)XK nuclease family protein [Gammaproteobacteria bacterium]|nr:PD-(D/E)XK nuclease family protein [Gammaproteobacteria bacterium]